MAKANQVVEKFEQVDMHPNTAVETMVDNVDASIVDAYYLPYKFPNAKQWSLFARVFYQCTPEYESRKFDVYYQVGPLDSLYPSLDGKTLSGGATSEQWKALATAKEGQGNVQDPDSFKGYYVLRALGSRAMWPTRDFYRLERSIARVFPDPEDPTDEKKTSFQFDRDIRCLVNPNTIYHLSRLSFDGNKSKEAETEDGKQKREWKVLVVSDLVHDGREEATTTKKKKGKPAPEPEEIEDEDDIDLEEEDIEEEELDDDEDEEEEDEVEEDEDEEDEEEEEEDSNDAVSVAERVGKEVLTKPLSKPELIPAILEKVKSMKPKERKNIMGLVQSDKWLNSKERPWRLDPDTKKYKRRVSK